jgi:flagellar hook assembly protein FlgD
VPVLDVTAEDIENIRSSPKRIFRPADERAFLNSPNPFGEPSKETTLFIYYLSEQSNVSFRIYTLTGELVWTSSYGENDPQGMEGLHSAAAHSVTWDGRNDHGLKVLNGVYVLVMETGYGDVQMTKIAVVK